MIEPYRPQLDGKSYPALYSKNRRIPTLGRDHWSNAISAMVAGGLRGGQVVRQTNDKAEYPVERPLKPGDLLATIYRVLGINPSQSFLDHAGRPVSILAEGEAIAELF